MRAELKGARAKAARAADETRAALQQAKDELTALRARLCGGNDAAASAAEGTEALSERLEKKKPTRTKTPGPKGGGKAPRSRKNKPAAAGSAVTDGPEATVE